MRIQNARQEIRNILSFFSENFSRPSFKIWNSDIRVEKNKNIFGKLAMLEDGIVIGGVLQESI
jgi:hypothetical protein